MKKAGKVSNPTCIAVNLVLCGDVLKKVLGKMGNDKKRLGSNTNKRAVLYELIASNPFTPTEEDIKLGIEVNSSRQK